jgi:hypothetical protein
MSGRFRWDFFISHSGEDTERIRSELVEPLRKERVRVVWDGDPEGAVSSGSLTANFKEWVEYSQFTLVVLSKAYNRNYGDNRKGANIRKEFELAEQAALRGGQPRVLMVKLEACGRPDKRMDVYVRGKVGDGRLIPRLVYQVRKEGVPAFGLIGAASALAVGSHWDDLLLGCLGTLLKLKRDFAYDVSVLVVCNAYGRYYYRVKQDGLTQKADRMYRALCKECGFDYLVTKMPPWAQAAKLMDRELRGKAEMLRRIMHWAVRYSGEGGRKPFSLIFTPPIEDRNDDHAATAEAVFSSFRDPHHTILEYVIKRYTDREMSPNLCVSFDESIAKKKEELIEQVCQVCPLTPDPNGAKNRKKARNEIRNSERLFSQEALRARVRKDALDYAKDWAIKYAEVFRGRIEL